MSRESFLARVRSAAAAGRAHRVHLRSDLPEHVGYCGAGDDPVERLIQEVNAVGGQAHSAANLAEAAQRLSELLRQYAPRTALCWQHELLDRLGLKALLESMNIARLDYDSLSPHEQAGQREQMFAAEIGISSVSAAIAETGTLALASRPGQERLASLLPPVHVALVEAAQIIPDLFDFFASLQAGGLENLPSNCVFITG
ncbi:MAG TPA: lactate utilization protein, partial [Pirellulales bacterium]|nr:lactate utilization protein [Pirellulales bacterium]